MSLLQGVLRSHATNDLLERKLAGLNLNRPSSPDRDENSDDELINVMSIPGTPARSQPPTRSSSPTRRAAARRLPGPLHLTARKPFSDPLKVLPTELSQRIFGRLSVSDLAKCARVSRKWSRSQTLNYVWFQHYRKENFHDDSLPPGKWTKRESKQNWRVTYLQSTKPASPRSRASGYSSPSLSGYQTPREIKEEQWKAEADTVSRPGKLEMREMYKELGGRKSRGKTKLGGGGGMRDRGGWGEEDGW